MGELEQIIAVWALRELKKKNEEKKVDASYTVCDRRNGGLFWTASEDLRRDEAKFF